MKVNHRFLNKDFNNPKWKVNTLILGTFNPLGEEFADYYYGRVKLSKKGKKRFSNRFWPSLTKYIQSIDNNSPDLLPGDYNSKKNLMRKLNFACLDLIKSVEVSEDKKADFIGNGYKHQPLFSTTTKRHYSTKDIVLLIKEKNKKSYCNMGRFY